MTCIIGIDPGTSCGWAVYDGSDDEADARWVAAAGLNGGA